MASEKKTAKSAAASTEKKPDSHSQPASEPMKPVAAPAAVLAEGAEGAPAGDKTEKSEESAASLVPHTWVMNNTLAVLDKTGIVLTTNKPDSLHMVPVRVLFKFTDGVDPTGPVHTGELKKVDSQMGSAHNDSRFAAAADPDNKDQSIYELARKLANFPPPQRKQEERRSRENPWLGAKTGIPGVYLWVEQDERGNLLVFTKREVDNPRGVAPLNVELRPPMQGTSSWTDKVLDDKGKPTGQSAIITKDVLVIVK